MKSQRSALLALVLGTSVMAAAACEDKTEITFPTPDIEVSVSPESVELEEGETATFVATVTGGAEGTARTVNWTTSNDDVASISANGNTVTVTAEGPGIATITATSTADAGAADAASVRVVDDEPSAPATISIQSVTFGNLNTPVNPDNVFGQIDVTLNVEVPPGNEISEVVTLLDGEEVCSQGFSSTGADLGLTAQELEAQAQVEIVCSIPTAAFDMNTGEVRFENGQHSLTAELRGPDDETVVATPSTMLFFNNQNFLRIQVASERTALGGTNGPGGLMPPGTQWRGGDLTFEVLGVNYGVAANNVSTVTLGIATSGAGSSGIAGCTSTADASVNPTIAPADRGAGAAVLPFCPQAGAARTVTLTPGAETLITFPDDASLSAGSPGVQNVEDVVRVTAVNSVTAGGQAGPICINPDPTFNPHHVGPGGAPCGFFFPNNNQIPVDNLAPRVTQLNILRPNQYFNDTFVPQHDVGVADCPVVPPGASATSNVPCARTVDYGVDTQTAMFSAGPAGSLTNVTAGFAPLPETQVSTTNVFQLVTTDALQNARTAYATTTNTIIATSATAGNVQLFGIDNTEPTHTVAGPPNNSTNCPPPAPSNPASCAGQTGWVVSFSDAGIGPSGFNANPVSVKLERILASGITCHNPNTGAAVSCSTASGFVADDGVITLPAPDGYYRLTTFVTDAASNTSAQTTILTLRDYTTPVAGGIASPATITGGAATSFSSALVDNVELGDVTGTTVFGGAGVYLVDSRQTIGTYGVDAIVATSPGTFNIASFIRSVETTSAAGLPTGTVSPATNFEYAARDVAGVQLNNNYADGCPAAGAGDGAMTQNCILRAVDISAAVNLGSNNTFPAYSSLNTLNGANAAHGLFVHQPPSDVSVDLSAGESTTLTTTLTGPAATFANPFTSVRYYMQDSNGRWFPIGTATVTVTDDTVLNTRTYTFTFVWTPTNLPPAAIPIIAVGTNASGSALLSQAQTVTLVP
jgi:Bacterial Ig-like domain (group 2)